MLDHTKNQPKVITEWGFLLLFGAAFPACVCLAALTNLLEARSDGSKLLKDCRRVVPSRVEGVGEPLKIFKALLLLAVPVNAALVVYTFKAATPLLVAMGVVPRGELNGELHDEDDGSDSSSSSGEDSSVAKARGEVWCFLLLCAFLFVALDVVRKLWPLEPEETSVQVLRQSFISEKLVEPFQRKQKHKEGHWRNKILNSFSLNPSLDIATAGAIFDQVETVRTTSGTANKAEVRA